MIRHISEKHNVEENNVLLKRYVKMLYDPTKIDKKHKNYAMKKLRQRRISYKNQQNLMKLIRARDIAVQKISIPESDVHSFLQANFVDIDNNSRESVAVSEWFEEHFSVYMNDELKDVVAISDDNDEDDDDEHLNTLSDDDRERFNLFAKLSIEQREGVELDFTKGVTTTIVTNHFDHFLRIQKMFFSDYFEKMVQHRFANNNVCKILSEMTVEFVRDDHQNNDDDNENLMEKEFFADERNADSGVGIIFNNPSSSSSSVDDRRRHAYNINEYVAYNEGGILFREEVYSECMKSISNKVRNSYNVTGSNWSLRRIISSNTTILLDSNANLSLAFNRVVNGRKHHQQEEKKRKTNRRITTSTTSSSSSSSSSSNSSSSSEEDDRKIRTTSRNNPRRITKSSSSSAHKHTPNTETRQRFLELFNLCYQEVQMDRKKREKIKRMTTQHNNNSKQQPLLLIPDLTKFDKEIVNKFSEDHGHLMVGETKIITIKFPEEEKHQQQQQQHRRNNKEEDENKQQQRRRVVLLNNKETTNNNKNTKLTIAHKRMRSSSPPPPPPPPKKYKSSSSSTKTTKPPPPPPKRNIVEASPPPPKSKKPIGVFTSKNVVSSFFRTEAKEDGGEEGDDDDSAVEDSDGVVLDFEDLRDMIDDSAFPQPDRNLYRRLSNENKRLAEEEEEEEKKTTVKPTQPSKKLLFEENEVVILIQNGEADTLEPKRVCKTVFEVLQTKTTTI